MKVATWQGESRFTFDEVADPAAGPGQVVVAVHGAGICGTDIHATQGLFPWTPPIVLGHEHTGVVLHVGRGASRRLLGRAAACEPVVLVRRVSRVHRRARLAVPARSAAKARAWASGGHDREQALS